MVVHYLVNNQCGEYFKKHFKKFDLPFSFVTYNTREEMLDNNLDSIIVVEFGDSIFTGVDEVEWLFTYLQNKMKTV